MKNSRVARRYAQALFEFAVERKQLEAVEGDLRLLAKQLDAVENLRQLIESPVIPKPAKVAGLKSAFEAAVQPETIRFLMLLVEKRREAHLLTIVEEFDLLMDVHRGIQRGDVYSVNALSEAQLRALKKQLDEMTGKDIRLRQHIDASLLGGLVVRIGDHVYDSSLRHQLQRLRKQLADA